MLNYKADRLLGRVEAVPELDQLKLFSFDLHDMQLMEMLSWLSPAN